MHEPSSIPGSRLSALLSQILRNDGSDLTIGLLIDRVGERGFGLLLLLLSLPSALPVPAPGYSIPFGILLCIFAWQMMSGRPYPLIPRRARRVHLTADLANKMLNATAWFFRRIEWMIRPRMRWVGSRGGRVLIGVLVFTMASIMFFPIPFTNTLPALVIFLLGIGLTEEDGLFALGACCLGLLTVVFYTSLIAVAIIHGPEAIDQFMDWLRSFYHAA
ncbi:MAG: exopolysaccharide biosynthesis protein [Opitutales bacterium]|nr:exopolysaccharide biosynthesis protein [Opitutales bacterium]